MLIQAELKAPKNQRNSFGKYNYRSCEDILEAVKPLLEKHECTITISDEIKQVGDLAYVESSVKFGKAGSEPIHTVKAQAGIDPNRKGMDIAQSFGSSSSYARKYALNGLFLIDDTKDADATNMHDKAPSKPVKGLSSDQCDEITDLLADTGITDAQFKKSMGKDQSDLSYDEAKSAISRLKKKLKEGK
jgi:hypothetical protein